MWQCFVGFIYICIYLLLFYVSVCVYCFRLLNEAAGSLLDNVQLVDTLQAIKVTATKVSEQVESSEDTKIEIDSVQEVRHTV